MLSPLSAESQSIASRAPEYLCTTGLNPHSVEMYPEDFRKRFILYPARWEKAKWNSTIGS